LDRPYVEIKATAVRLTLQGSSLYFQEPGRKRDREEDKERTEGEI
jgi:hypothetical protein